MYSGALANTDLLDGRFAR